MKKHIGLIFGVSAMALAGAAGALLGQQGGAVETKAAVSENVYTLGNVTAVELAANDEDASQCWNVAGAKLAVYFWAEGHEAWSDLVTMDATVFKYLVPNSLDFIPSTMNVVRFNSAVTVPSWNNYDDNVWGEYKPGSYADAAYIKGWMESTSVFNRTTYIASDKTSWGQQEDHVLSHVKSNDNNHFEVYGDIDMQEYENFKLVNADGEWLNNYSVEPAISGNFKREGDNANIYVTEGNAWNYFFFYDATNKTFHITCDYAIEADDYAKRFLADMKCDGEDNITQDKWSDLSSTYQGLTEKALGLLTKAESSIDPTATNIARALGRYDYIVTKYTVAKYADFMKRGEAGTLNTTYVSGAIAVTPMEHGNRALIAVGSVLAIGAIASCAMVFLRRRKEN